MLGLSLLTAVAILMLGLLPKVTGWGEGLLLVGLSALANLSVAPEIGHFRKTRRMKRLLMAFLFLQVFLGITVGYLLVTKISTYSDEVWSPSGLSLELQVNELFRMIIGVSEDQNLLPIVAWLIAFHGVFISAMTGLSYWTLLPSASLAILGFLWSRGQPVGILGYAFLLLTMISVGLEGLTSSIQKAVAKGLPPSIFSQKGRQLVILSLTAIILAPLVPDFRGLTPIERIWDINSTEQAQYASSRLRFSTVYTFAGKVRRDFSPALLVRSRVPLFWRGIIFDRYTGREFLVENTSGSPYVSNEVLPSSYSNVGNLSTEVEQNYILLANFPGILFNAYEPRLVREVNSFKATESMMLLTAGSNIRGTTYTVVSNLVTPEPEILRMMGEPKNANPRYLQLPESLPKRVGDLAKELTDGYDNPFDKAIAIAQHLKTFRYDLMVPSIPPGRDVVDYFLFDLQAGYCQHFAAAMVVLCREIGIPARVVTGFGSGVYDSSEEAYKVLQQNFHAWVEAYFEGFGWVAFDPTSGGVGGPNVQDAAEANVIMEGILPYYGTIEKRPTRIFITATPEYISGDQAFIIEGAVLEVNQTGKGVPRIQINVTLDVRDIDILPPLVKRNDKVSILMGLTRTSSDGTFIALCMLPEGVERVAEEANVQVVCLGNELYGTSTLNLSLPVRRRAIIDLKVETVPAATVTVSLVSPVGPLAGQEVEMFLDGNLIGTYLTNASGAFNIKPKVSSGTHTIVARYAGNGTIGSASVTREFKVQLPEGGTEKGGLAIPAGIISALLAAVLIITLMFFRWRQSHLRTESIAHLYQIMLTSLSRAGINKPVSLTPYEFASFLEQRGEKGHRLVRFMTERFVEGIYAGKELTSKDLSQVKRNLRELESILGRRGFNFRNFLGKLEGIGRGLI